MLVSIEGQDASGKSTLIKNLQLPYNRERLEHMGFVNPKFTKQPGDSELANRLRAIVLNVDVDIIEELSMMLISIYSNLTRIVVPALKDNRLVISDRFTYSTMVYQITGCEDTTKLDDALSLMCQYINMMPVNKPALTLIMNPDPSITLARQAKRGLINRLDANGIKQATLRHEAYKALYEHESIHNNIVYIDEEVSERDLVEIFFKALSDMDKESKLKEIFSFDRLLSIEDDLTDLTRTYLSNKQFEPA